MMKVKELQALLSKFDPETPVLMSGPDVGGYDVEWGDTIDAWSCIKSEWDNSEVEKGAVVIRISHDGQKKE